MIKVGIADDHKLVRKSLCALMNSFDDISVALEADNGKILLQKLEETTIDILLLDICMPVMDGFEACKAIAEKYPDIKILIISHLISKESIMKAMQMGAHGYFSKNADPEYLESALRSIHESGFYFEPGISSILNEIILDDKRTGRDDNPLNFLTQKEIKLIKLVCRGFNSEEIANILSINIRTVESYRRRILEKTEARNFTVVILMAIKYRYVEHDSLLMKTASP